MTQPNITQPNSSHININYYEQYAQDNFWYQSGRTIDATKPDVFYVVSTMIIESYDAEGNEVFRAALNKEDRDLLDEELNDIATNMFNESFNFFAPYYHEITMHSAMVFNGEEQKKLFAETLEEVVAAFNYYMENLNNGRPFILAGFSQGAIMVKGLLKQMTDEQYHKMTAAYAMGGPITAEDLIHPHIVTAQSEDDLGVVISYNSVANLGACWEPLTASNIACINPLNWTTDTTPAPFEYDGEAGIAQVDPIHHVLIIEGIDPEKHHDPEWPFPLGNYHADEIHFYAEAIRKNALLRLEKFQFPIP